MGNLHPLIEVSRHYGDDSAYVIAGGGNTSFKDESQIWIKASGIALAGIGEGGFVKLSRAKLGEIEDKTYSEDPILREEQVKSDLNEAIISPENLRPSVETSLHNLIDYAFVVHTHPTLVNGLMCAMNVKDEVKKRFGRDALYVEYTDPGFILFKKVQEDIRSYREQYGKVPSIIFLQNHGVFVGADSVEEIHTLYESINKGLLSGTDISLPEGEPVVYESEVSEAISSFYTSRNLLSRAVSSELTEHFSESVDSYQLISWPFSPDIIVYCKSNYLFLGEALDPDLAIAACEQFERTHGYYPKVIIEEKKGLIVLEENESSLNNVQDVFLDQMKISYLSENFGGPHFMTADQIQFIDNWEVENYRRKVAKNA